MQTCSWTAGLGSTLFVFSGAQNPAHHLHSVLSFCSRYTGLELLAIKSCSQEPVWCEQAPRNWALVGVFADPQGQGGEPLWHTGQLFLRLPLFSWMSQAGLCPGTGPGSRALTLGVTRPVHPAQQKCTGCSSGSNSSRVGRSPWPHSCHGLFHPSCAVGHRWERRR